MGDLVHDAALDFGSGVNRADRFRQAFQAVYARNQDVLQATVLEIGQALPARNSRPRFPRHTSPVLLFVLLCSLPTRYKALCGLLSLLPGLCKTSHPATRCSKWIPAPGIARPLPSERSDR